MHAYTKTYINTWSHKNKQIHTCIYTHVLYIYIEIYAYISLHKVNRRISIRIHTYPYTYTHIYICRKICTHTCIYIHTNICTYMHIYINMYAYIKIYFSIFCCACASNAAYFSFSALITSIYFSKALFNVSSFYHIYIHIYI